VEAGIDRDRLYVTNAVKHFKLTRMTGQRRIHKTPRRTEVVACRPWLFAELAAVQADVLVLLGANAAQSLLGSGFRLTAHPSSVLRGPVEERSKNFDALVADLRFAAGLRSS